MLLVLPSNSGNDALLNKAVNSSVHKKTRFLLTNRFKFLTGWFNIFFASRALAYGLKVQIQLCTSNTKYTY